MSPLLKALEENEVSHPKTNKRSIMIITCPEVCKFPSVLTQTGNIDVIYSQNFEFFMLGIMNPEELRTFWDSTLSSISLHEITDVVFLSHYPCHVLETIQQGKSPENITEHLSSSLLKIKEFINKNMRNRDFLSRWLICKLTEINRQAFISYPDISRIQDKNALNIHTWLFDEQEQKIYLSHIDKENVIKLSEISHKY